jgi:branched-chain amino acid transport system ATP-binding protein
MTAPILSVSNVSKSFGGLRASDDISLDVAAKSFHAIIGPNGAGKSTFFNLISGFIKPDSGRIQILDKDMTGQPPHRLFHAGLSRTFQLTSIFPNLTVVENIQVALLSSARKTSDFFRSARRQHVEQCDELLELVGLPARDCRIARILSHGDQKKLELAVALASRPRLLLLDEPTAGMAANERLDSIRSVHRIANELGLTVLFTEHDMQVVFSVSDRISVLHQGAIIADGLPGEIRTSKEVQRIYLGEAADKR